MTEEFNIFKNLEDLRKINILDQLKCLEPDIKTDGVNESQDLDNSDFDFDSFLNNKSPTKRKGIKEKFKTSEKKTKKNAKSRKMSTSTDGSLSPPMPFLENLNKKVDALPVCKGTRRSRGAIRNTSNSETILEIIEGTSSRAKGRGKGRGRGRGRGRGKANSNTAITRDSIDLLDNSLGIQSNTSSNGSSNDEEAVLSTNSTLSLMERFLQQSRNGRSRVMRARRQYISEIAARSTQVDFIDLVSSPLPCAEGFVNLDTDTDIEESTPTTRITRSKKKNQEKFSINSNKNKVTKNSSLNVSFDDDNPELNIKVNWKGKPESFKLRKYQKFSVIFQQLAERENISEDSIVFNLNDRLIIADDTPESINYKIFNFIDGRVVDNGFISPRAVVAAIKKRDVNKITLKIQSDKWKRPLQIDVLKTNTFRILYIKCAEELKVGLDQLKLSFDGELLELNGTPADLDLEGGEAIDLHIKN